jgi:hypothetical protein
LTGINARVLTEQDGQIATLGGTAGLAALGVLRKKVPQCPEELVRVLTVASMQGRADVLDDHLVNLLRAAPLLQQIFSVRRGRDFGDVLMLRQREHLSLGQST